MLNSSFFGSWSLFDLIFFGAVCIFSVACPVLMIVSLIKSGQKRIVFVIGGFAWALICFFLPLGMSLQITLFFVGFAALIFWAFIGNPSTEAIALCRIANYVRNPENIIKVSNEALRIDNECPEAYYLLAKAESKKGNEQLAISHLKMAEVLFWKVRWDFYWAEKTKRIQEQIIKGENPVFEKMLLYYSRVRSNDPYQGLSDETLMEKAKPLFRLSELETLPY